MADHYEWIWLSNPATRSINLKKSSSFHNMFSMNTDLNAEDIYLIWFMHKKKLINVLIPKDNGFYSKQKGVNLSD